MGHDLPQPPQFAGSVAMGASQPFSGFMSQSAKPAAQLVTMHLPPAQACVLLAPAQAWAQAPQSFGLDIVGVSQPLETTPSQSANPMSQDAIAQRPALHAVTPFATAPHA